MNKYEDGIYNISDRMYHGSQGYSRSQLLIFDRKSPYHFWYEYLSGKAEKKQPTPAMTLGSLFHCLVLEPENLSKKFAVLPDINRRTKDGKEQYTQFVEDNMAKEIATKDQMDIANQMADAVLSDKNISLLLSNTTVEQSIFFTDNTTSLQFKSRPDAFKNGHIIDIKTANDVSYRHMSNECVYRGYFLQAGMMKAAFKAMNKEFNTYTILACEKDAPYSPKVFQLDEDCIEWGLSLFHKIAQQIKSSIETEVWPSYEPELMELPRYLEGDL